MSSSLTRQLCPGQVVVVKYTIVMLMVESRDGVGWVLRDGVGRVGVGNHAVPCNYLQPEAALSLAPSGLSPSSLSGNAA